MKVMDKRYGVESDTDWRVGYTSDDVKNQWIGMVKLLMSSDDDGKCCYVDPSHSNHSAL